MSDDSHDRRLPSANGGTRPVPDPTRLTDAAIARSDKAMRDYIDGQLAIRDERLRGIDEATRLRLAGLDDLSDRIDLKVGALKELHSEKHVSIATQFNERDTRSEHAAQESRISLDAALAAAKEAVSEQNKANTLAIGKSEDATKERLDSLGVLMITSNKSLEDQIRDLKGRLDRGEGVTTGASDTRTEARLSTGALVSLVSVAVAAVAVAANFIQ